MAHFSGRKRKPSELSVKFQEAVREKRARKELEETIREEKEAMRQKKEQKEIEEETKKTHEVMEFVTLSRYGMNILLLQTCSSC